MEEKSIGELQTAKRKDWIKIILIILAFTFLAIVVLIFIEIFLPKIQSPINSLISEITKGYRITNLSELSLLEGENLLVKNNQKIILAETGFSVYIRNISISSVILEIKNDESENVPISMPLNIGEEKEIYSSSKESSVKLKLNNIFNLRANVTIKKIMTEVLPEPSGENPSSEEDNYAASLTCAEQQGEICEDYTECRSQVVAAADTNQCCLDVCYEIQSRYEVE